MKTIYQMKQEAHWPVLLTDHQGLITYVNESFRKVFGWTNDEIIGQTLEIVIPNSYRDAHHLGFSRFAVTEQSTVLNHPLQLMAVTKNGREILSEHFIAAEQQQGQWIFGAILRPIKVE
jgi:PAS domain S-box-containing protein